MEDDVKALYELDWAARAARLLHAANSLDLFTILADEPMTCEQVSGKCESNPQMTEKILIGLTAMRLLQKQGDRYANTQLSQTYLVRGRPLYQGDIIAHGDSVLNVWNALEDRIRNGPGPISFTPDQHKSFIMGMHNIAVAGRAQMLVDNVDLSGQKKLFDVGGGPGTYSIFACRRWSQLKAIVFDMPETIAITKQMIAKENMAERITAIEGDWDSDDFGAGNDVVLLSDVMHGPAGNAEIKLGKAYDSMVNGGLVVIQEFLLNDEKTGPLAAALFNIMVGAYSQKELFLLIEQAGFSGPKLVAACDEIGSSWVTAVKK